MKLLGSTKSRVTKNRGGENFPHLEIIEVVLVQNNIVNDNYKRSSRVLYIFVPNQPFGQLLDISPKKFIVLKTFDSEFSYIEVWFTDQSFKPQDIEDKYTLF